MFEEEVKMDDMPEEDVVDSNHSPNDSNQNSAENAINISQSVSKNTSSNSLDGEWQQTEQTVTITGLVDVGSDT